ncbi:STAS domain-containing protein [Cellvibrio sp.]|uniref:STAS domain-containing protein n=1 Tax=Cellvibrio sp. TaxID=1965322 RepID=UPI0039648720
MRRKVPFLGEDQIVRDGDEAAQAKKARAQVIDDILSTNSQPSTWDDLVTSDYPDPLGLQPPSAARAPVIPRKPRPKTVPVTPGPVPALKKAIIESAFSKGLSTIDWLPINSGHGLRINICGQLDQNLRAEWRRLLEETERTGVGQFEFNFTEAPSLSLTGLGLLLLFKEQKKSERGDIKLCHCNREVWQMLQWTGMDKYFTIQGIPGGQSNA